MSAATQSAHTPQATDDVTSQIHAFLRQQNFPAQDNDTLEATPLLASGALDSLAVLQLMMFLGDTYGIEIRDEDFTPETFATVGSLAAFVRARRTL
ncbi:MAG: acyl carrier protein [Hyphomicrobiaceae bacterium]